MIWSLRRSFPDAPFSMVAEEDAEDLRCVQTLLAERMGASLGAVGGAQVACLVAVAVAAHGGQQAQQRAATERRCCAWHSRTAEGTPSPATGHAVPRRKPAGEAMAGRITELVNAVLRAEEGANALTSAQVLDLIDLGASPGGSEVRTTQMTAFQMHAWNAVHCCP